MLQYVEKYHSAKYLFYTYADDTASEHRNYAGVLFPFLHHIQYCVSKNTPYHFVLNLLLCCCIFSDEYAGMAESG
jgi:hypothetical protein